MKDECEITRHQDLDVYRKSFEAALQIFAVSKQFPKEETYCQDHMNNSSEGEKRRRGEEEKGTRGERENSLSPSHPFSPSQISILIADDHPVFRAGLRQVVEMNPDLKVVAEAEDGTAALAGVREHRPDVAVLDVDMPGMDGFDVVRALRQEKLAVEVVFLTMHKDEDIFNAAMNIDVRGYVVKDSAVTDIAASIRAVHAGRPFISPAVSAFLLNRTQRTTRLTQEKPGLEQLTPTERRILKLLADNKTSREIGGELFVSHRTVENHRANICQKLGLHGNHALLKFALENKSQLF